MDTELSMEFELEIKGAPAEREEDLFSGLDALTYLNENLPWEDNLNELLEEEEGTC